MFLKFQNFSVPLIPPLNSKACGQEEGVLTEKLGDGGDRFGGVGASK